MGLSLFGFRFRAGAALSICLLTPLAAQEPSAEPETRAEKILAERRAKAVEAKPAEPNSVEKKLLILKDRSVLQGFGKTRDGFLPNLGSVARGQGFTLGVQYNKSRLAGGHIDFGANALASFNRAYRYNFTLTAPRLADERLELSFLAEQRNMPQVDFYGFGPESDLEDRTSYLQEDTNISGSFAYKPFGRHVRAGIRAGAFLVNVGHGRRALVPSTEEVFSPVLVPGLSDQTNFLRAGPFLELDFRDNPKGPRAGSYFVAEYMYFNDRQLGRHDFRELEMEAQQYFPFFSKKRVVVLRAHSVFTYANGLQTVPFYLKPWIGGSRELRGFSNYRFIDNNTLVLNAEYRWEAFSGLDMALFFDAGQVAAKRDQFRLSEMETAAGVGFRFNIRNSTFMRFDLAFSHESTRLWIRFGSPF